MFTHFFWIFLVLQAIVVPIHGSEPGDFGEDAEAKPGRSLPSSPRNEEGENNCPLSPKSLNLGKARTLSLGKIPALGKVFTARCK